MNATTTLPRLLLFSLTVLLAIPNDALCQKSALHVRQMELIDSLRQESVDTIIDFRCWSRGDRSGWVVWKHDGVITGTYHEMRSRVIVDSATSTRSMPSSVFDLAYQSIADSTGYDGFIASPDSEFSFELYDGDSVYEWSMRHTMALNNLERSRSRLIYLLGTGLFSMEILEVTHYFNAGQNAGTVSVTDSVINGVPVRYPKSSYRWQHLVVDSILDEVSRDWNCVSSGSVFEIKIRRFPDTCLAVDIIGTYNCRSGDHEPRIWNESNTYVKDGNTVYRLVLRDTPEVHKAIASESSRMVSSGQIDSSCIGAQLRKGLGFLLLDDGIEIRQPYSPPKCDGLYRLSRDPSLYERELFLLLD